MIVLLTDFGQSEYVGMMKGVIHSINASETIVDLTHDISPQLVREGAWVLLRSYRYFPMGTIFVTVIDPGVGTERDPVLVKTNNYIFIGPDNGVLYPTAHSDGIQQIFKIDIGIPDSETFHGRDVFAKFAAFYAIGRHDEYIGEVKKQLDVRLNFHLDGRTGEIVRKDRFGNLITNLITLDKESYSLSHEKLSREIGWFSTYKYGPSDDVFLVTGSAGTLEFSWRNGRAADVLPFEIGEHITIE